MSTTRSPHARPHLSQIVRAGAGAAVIAVIANTALYFSTKAAGIFDSSSAGVPDLAAIAGMSFIAPIAATVLFALLSRFATRPGIWFGVTAAMVFVGFVPGPVMLSAPLGTTFTLEAMHLIVASLAVAGLLKTLTPVGEQVPARASRNGLAA